MTNKEIKDLNATEFLIFETIRTLPMVGNPPSANTDELIKVLDTRIADIEQDTKHVTGLLSQYKEAIIKLANSKKGIFG